VGLIADRGLLSLHNLEALQASTKILGEIDWNGLRLIVAHDPPIALGQRVRRSTKVAEFEYLDKSWVGKLRRAGSWREEEGAQPIGQWHRGPVLSGGVRSSPQPSHQG
jgi:hypothetical protein